MRSLIWFRGHDLRVRDQPALREACKADGMVTLLAPDVHSPDRDFANAAVFFAGSARDLARWLEERDQRLHFTGADPADVLPALIEAWDVDRAFALRGTDPRSRRQDARLLEALGDRLELFEGHLLHPPGTLRTRTGTPYAVFTPFSRTFRAEVQIDDPLDAPRHLPPAPAVAHDCLEPLPDPGRPEGVDLLDGGESAARKRLRAFLRVAADYPTDRDRMDRAGTSRLSADLKFGCLSPRMVWRTVEENVEDSDAVAVFTNELIWREFNASTLVDRPELVEEPFREDWRGFPWRDDEHGWQAWVEGRTGVPVVDASARQLLGEGFVHNRARMISASFLTKHLLIDYARGEAHYRRHLVDGDAAQNIAGWQWSAGCGCDAQPWFRIFNPVSQGRKFDPDGAYVRRWIPELERMPDRWIHEPWEAPAEVLDEAGITLGEDYPEPVVGLKEGRERFLAKARAHLGDG